MDGNKITVYMVNTVHNPDVSLQKSEFSDEWNWVEAAVDWSPAKGLPDDATDIIIVFARKYAEQEALSICKEIRSCSAMDKVPLLVAISMYQMPLGNDVKRLPNAGMIFMPLQEEDLQKRLREFSTGE